MSAVNVPTYVSSIEFLLVGANMLYKVILQPSDEGFAVSVLGLPGCHSQGSTEQDALDNIRDALRDYLEVVAQLGQEHIVREVEVEI